MSAVPVVDLFAGPGGLGEGFASVADSAGRQVFDLVFSVEKDAIAHSTLRLRAAFRRLRATGQLRDYLDYVQGRITYGTFSNVPAVRDALAAAAEECRNQELGACNVSALDRDIRAALKGNPDWLLIGGPPCQAYSLVGRARRANDAKFEEDEKHFLYREYLRIIRVHRPAVFIMENVKGLLSSSHSGHSMFARILQDVSAPARGLGYEIRSMVKAGSGEDLEPVDFVIESERYGIPQTRHRVILLGVRSDWADREHELLRECPSSVNLESVISGLPKIRSKLSREPDSPQAWHAAVSRAPSFLKGWGVGAERQIVSDMKVNARRAGELQSPGAPFIETRPATGGMPDRLRKWIVDPTLGGILQHESRPHMASDLARYMFAATFTRSFGYMPRLNVYPPGLLPDHASATAAEGGDLAFKDRFRVQAGGPSTTIMSHISKDGHYYIHHDPVQCRSFTVREAARLQTFPDNYFFEGGRTQQYVQVGNAVPPLLAHQIAQSVAGLFRWTRATRGSRQAEALRGEMLPLA
jgi:DNA (cytosine-5)-methyltransferase 1